MRITTIRNDGARARAPVNESFKNRGQVGRNESRRLFFTAYTGRRHRTVRQTYNT